MAQSHDHNLTPLALLEFTLYLSKTRAHSYCFITFRIPLHCSSSQSFLCILSSNLKLSSTRSSKGMIFLLRWLFLLTFCVNTTAWVCLFPSHLHFSSSFLFPLFSISRVGRVFPRVSSFFHLKPHFINPFPSSFFSFPQWRVLKRRPILQPQGSTTEPFTPGPPTSCSLRARV